MREILFRGKRTDNGEWVEGSLVLPNYELPNNAGLFLEGMAYICTSLHSICVEDYDRRTLELAGFVQVDPTTVGQYTGFYDKEGKKIFEGDILRFRHGSRYPVFWDADCGAFGSCYYTDFDILSKYNGVYDEVIGNIHDNPELLEVDNG